MSRVTILGDGGWGTAFGLALLDRGHSVSIWGAFPDYIEEVRRSRRNHRFLDGFPIPKEVEYEPDLIRAVAGADFIVNATPTQWVRGIFERLAENGFSGGHIISLSKGIENGTLKRVSEIITELINPADLCVISGPSHAEEIARKLPASIVSASSDLQYAELIQREMSSDCLRIYTETDIIGVEVSGALKNVIALAAGMCDGLELGDNAKAALVTRGAVEIARFGVAWGAKPRTFYGLSGIGDLMTTCYSGFGRNRSVGVRIGRGEHIDAILGNMVQVAEGVWTVKSVMPLAEKLNVSMPISAHVFQILFEGLEPREAVRSLMSRDFRQEKEEWAIG